MKRFHVIFFVAAYTVILIKTATVKRSFDNYTAYCLNVYHLIIDMK